jgi:NAD(P)-dependent dehydrogenase (short-subunit alcohol dehydrogenase family)
MTARTAVITGGASGLGAEMARQLAARGWHVVIACRDRSKGNRVAAEINSGGVGSASVAALDVSVRASIRAFGAEAARTLPSVDVLVNNAGAIYEERRIDPRGVELTFATNVLGYFLVTNEMLPLLERSESARVVDVASTFAFGLDLDDVQFAARPYDALAAYAQSKACDRLLTYAHARRLSSNGITCNAVAPGLMLDTELYRHLSEPVRAGLAQYPHHTTSDGVDTPLWVATSPELAGVTGRFFESRTDTPCEFRGEDAEERLWAECERLSVVHHVGDGAR